MQGRWVLLGPFSEQLIWLHLKRKHMLCASTHGCTSFQALCLTRDASGCY